MVYFLKNLFILVIAIVCDCDEQIKLLITSSYGLKYFIIFYRKFTFIVSYHFFIITFLIPNCLIIGKFTGSLYDNIITKLWTITKIITYCIICIYYITNNCIFNKVILNFKRKNKTIFSFTMKIR